MSEWQPIETIPKDGSSVLVCNNTLEDAYCVVSWDSDSKTEWTLTPLDGSHYHQRAFTHWMKLPLPPSTRRAG